MGSPLVRCSGCERAWHSTTMAAGLRSMSGCPRCGGALVFAEGLAETATENRSHEGATGTAPHLVLGLPRR